MPNEYTRSWQRTFLDPTSPTRPRQEKTDVQLRFLQDQLPLPDFRRVLDVCCGLGRHAIPLSRLGYEVLGIDRDEGLVNRAMAQGSTARFQQLDMRELHVLDSDFDAVVCLWQSFGYFDPDENEAVLRQMAERLRPGGRLILDLYNRNLYDATSISRGGGGRHSHVGGLDWIQDARYDKGASTLNVWLEWSSGERDHFQWQLYSPEELKTLGEMNGLREVLTCADFNPAQVAGNRREAFQIVFERRP